MCFAVLIVNIIFISVNRVIPITIAIFRYILVCKARWRHLGYISYKLIG